MSIFKSKIFKITFVIIVLMFFTYKPRDTYRCKICFAKNETFQWRFGSWGGSSIPLTTRWEDISETNFLKDFIGESGHNHEWDYAQGSPNYILGLGGFGCAIGGGRHISQLCEKYEKNLGFRAFIQKKLFDGLLNKQKFIEMYSFKPYDGKVSLEKEGNDLCYEFDDEEWIKEARKNYIK